jgi:hypothetical protein
MRHARLSYFALWGFLAFLAGWDICELVLRMGNAEKILDVIWG